MAQTCRERIAKQRRPIMYKIIMKTLGALSSASYPTQLPMPKLLIAFSCNRLHRSAGYCFALKGPPRLNTAYNWETGLQDDQMQLQQSTTRL